MLITEGKLMPSDLQLGGNVCDLDFTTNSDSS